MIPLPDQFSWRAKIGLIHQTGRGLLTKAVKDRRADIEEFTVAVGGLIAAAFPKLGQLHLDHRKVAECPCRESHSLIWFWRHAIRLSDTHNPNTGPPSYECYGLGLECASGKFGVRFMADGTIQSGLE